MKYHLVLFIITILGVKLHSQSPATTYLKGEDLLKKTAKYLFIKVAVDKKTAYEGEAITADYHLYVAVDLQGKMSKAPSYSGFASYEIEKGNENEYTIEQRDGVVFKVYPIKSVQLFGLQPGIGRIEPIKFDATVRYQSKMAGLDEITPFPKNDTLYNFEIKSEPVEISIKPLPKFANTKFTGAVGNFEINASLSDSVILKNQPDTFRIAIKGYGNWHSVSMPEINFPDGLEVFQPIINEVFDEKKVPLKGLKVYAYPFIGPRNQGVVFLPVALTFFNPELKKYQTVKTDSLPLQIEYKDYLEEKPIKLAAQPNRDITKIFTRWAIIIFPCTAVLLILVLWAYYRKKSN